MTPAELAVALAAPTSPLVGRALALLTPTAAQCLANEASGAALAGWQTIVADRVQAFAAEQPEGREAVVADAAARARHERRLAAVLHCHSVLS
ncbi:hypothetical protein, partial [Streptomyces spectabilis]|uniref:hypothetical protein n=1 Tax=Streptomyces spectabilis TaxID=68270 RepID=UPI0033C3C8AD